MDTDMEIVPSFNYVIILTSHASRALVPPLPAPSISMLTVGSAGPGGNQKKSSVAPNIEIGGCGGEVGGFCQKVVPKKCEVKIIT